MKDTESMKKFADEVILQHLRQGIDPDYGVFSHPYSENFTARDLMEVHRLAENTLKELADFFERAVREG